MVAIVPDRAQFAAEMRQDCAVNFPILSDMDNGYAMSLNLAIWVGAEMKEYMTKIGRMLPDYQGNDILDAADPGDICCWQGRPDQIALRRSGLSQTYDDRRIDRCAEINQLVLFCQFAARNIFIKVAATGVRCRPATP